MAEYLKFRLTAAKVGVTMAFFALLAGLADRVGGRPAITATPAADVLSPTKLKLGPTSLLKLEKKLLKLDATLHKLQKLEGAMYTRRQADGRFLKITDADNRFLKIEDANAEFLKLDGTASNAYKLRGMTPDEFVQGHANVVSGTLSIADNATGTKLLMGDGSVSILIGLYQPPTGGSSVPAVILQNNTPNALNFTFNGGSLASGGTSLHGGGGTATLLPAVQSQNTGEQGGQLDIQLFGSGAGKVWTVTVSNVPGDGTHSFVGQLLAGAL